MNRLKGRALVLGVALGLAWLLGMPGGGALAQSPEVRVTLKVWNKATPGPDAPTYEIKTIMLTRGFFPILTQYIFPPASIRPGDERTFEFEVATAPDGLTISGRRIMDMDSTPFSFTFYPIYSGFTGTKDSLEVTVQITPQYPWPPYPWPPYPTAPPVNPATIQAELAKGPRYFAIAQKANQSLSPQEKAMLAEKIQPLLMEAQGWLGGPMVAPTVRAYVPTELHATLTSIAQRINSAAIEALGIVMGVPKAQELNLLSPILETMLKPPQTHWTCYWSYVHAWWTFICAYWNYIVNDHPLGLWTLVQAYFSLVYAYWCYVAC